jgi:plastocyanin
MPGYRKLINLVHILIVVPLLYALATDKFPSNYKQYVVWLAIAIGLYHLYLFLLLDVEGMDTVYGSKIHHIKIFDSSPGYDKPNLEIKQGDIVVWTNIGEVEHTVTADNGEFNSSYLKPSENYSVKFDHPGKFYYTCMHHKGWMKGLIVVK